MKLLATIFFAMAIINPLFGQEKIRLVGAVDYPPFEFYTANKEPRGIIPDFWELWSERTNIPIDYQLMPWKEAMNQVIEGRADAIAGINRTSDREAYWDFSEPYLKIPAHIFFHKSISGIQSLSDISGFRIGVIKRDFAEEYLKKHLPDAQLMAYTSVPELLDAAEKKEVMVMIIDTPIMLFHMAKRGNAEFKRTDKPIYTNELHVGVRKGRADLLNLINKGIQDIDQTEIEAIEARWTGIILARPIYWQWLLGGTALALLSAALFFLWNRQLRKQVEEATRAIQQSEIKYRAIYNAANDGILVVNPVDGEILDANNRTCTMYGYTYEEIRNLTVEDLSKDRTLASHYSKDRTREAMSGMTEPFEWEAKRKDDSVFWIEVHLSYVALLENTKSIVVVVRDISERKNSEQKILQLNRDLEKRVIERTKQLEDLQKELVEEAHRAGMADIASNVLHNVGNILNSVITSSHVIENRIRNGKTKIALKQVAKLLRENLDNIDTFILEDPKGQQLIQYILGLEERQEREQEDLIDNVNRLITKVQAIQDVVVSQQSYASGITYTERLSVADIVQDATNIESKPFIRAGVALDVQYISGLKDVPVQKAKLIHIIINLLKNAREAMAHKPVSERWVRIHFEQTDENIIVRIQDNGEGIKPENLPKVFEHGFTTKNDGHGFGLHSCGIYMEEMGGSIKVASEGAEKGCIFTLTFPIPKEIDEAPPLNLPN